MHCNVTSLVFALSLLMPPALVAANDAVVTDSTGLGRRIENFSLKSQFAKEYSLNDFESSKLVVVIFVGTECPLAKLYAPRLAELSKKFSKEGVAFLAIDSNQQDSIQKIAAFGQRHQIEFPILKDPGNVVADQFGARRTPEVFLLDQDRSIRYTGRIDDQYGFRDSASYQRAAATRNDLEQAIGELLASKPVSVPTTTAIGCVIGRAREVNKDSTVTYSDQIARIFQNRCVECHREGQIGPFVMTGYDDVVGWGEMIKEVVQEGRMPPWHASPAHGKFKNDVHLSDREKKLIAEWVDNGCPEGDPSKAPPARAFTEGWTIGKPDQVIFMRDEPVHVPAEGVVDYYHLVVDPGWKEDKWVIAAEARPDSLSTVHHILVFVQSPEIANALQGGRLGVGGISGGELIAAYAPGQNPLLTGESSTAMHVKAGSKLIFQMHYTPNGVPQDDRSYVGFRFANPAQVKNEARCLGVVNFFFAIPPGAEAYASEAQRVFDYDTAITSLMPHMHTRGKQFRYEAVYPDGTAEVLLDIPAYDFNWQTNYYLKEPKSIPKGTKLVCSAQWDNSEGNLANPDPTKVVTWGEQTWEEMMIGFYVEVFPKGEAPPRPDPLRALKELDPAKVLKSLDANQDGQLTKEELPSRLAQVLPLADSDRSGGINEAELGKLLNLFVTMFQRKK